VLGATTQAASDDSPSQRRGWRGVLSFSFEVRVRQGRVTLPCKSLRGVPAPNTNSFPYPRTYSSEYKAWRNAMKCKIEQEWIPGWKQSTATQWAAIQAHALTLRPVRQRLGLCEADYSLREGFTESLDLWLKDIGKKASESLNTHVESTCCR